MSVPPGDLTDAGDVEKQDPLTHKTQYRKQWKILSLLNVHDGEVYESHPEKNPKWYQRILDVGVEENGIRPVPLEQRTQKRYWNLGTLMCSALINLLPFVVSCLSPPGTLVSMARLPANH